MFVCSNLTFLLNDFGLDGSYIFKLAGTDQYDCMTIADVVLAIFCYMVIEALAVVVGVRRS